MSRDGSIDLELGANTYRFRLAIGELEKLQEETGIGAPEHLHRLYVGENASWRHVRAILLVGLIGGGLGVSEAHAVARGLDDMPAVRAIAVAALVMAAALEGAEDEPLPHRASKKDDSEPLPDGKMAFKAFYEAAAVMQLPHDDMRKMSLWQFHVYVAGYNRGQNPDKPDPLSDQEEDALWNWLNEPMAGAA
ncbi:hypothetical protein LNAOJCKE_5180 [Methylorubrum aminovorans]|uniref:Uncharacterized protein n=1 Tax=Methylorubrum aminovorans TaxID=269069 RepID=A0ABQ4UKY6_9HYPH|nr:GTA-gp10 family protein [Methylorubrum aminovorans]GJE67945.1 hypothetical protein LNAOJCKE_5180 [Methylorubrum aminovorans]GMA76353.1 hypothetical protein GCM10025880_27700 [Methylorubrum aminovorans]